MNSYSVVAVLCSVGAEMLHEPGSRIDTRLVGLPVLADQTGTQTKAYHKDTEHKTRPVSATLKPENISTYRSYR
jgi:hypothetical protein